MGLVDDDEICRPVLAIDQGLNRSYLHRLPKIHLRVVAFDDAMIDTKERERFTALLDQLLSVRKKDAPLSLRYSALDDAARGNRFATACCDDEQDVT
jgi:hypothetical protein